jgi:uncharacterized pyridoxamine 5'-phosphate oxidase family protein
MEKIAASNIVLYRTKNRAAEGVMMRDVIQFLEGSPVGALATVEGGVPRVRPFQFMLEEGGALWFCTSSEKRVYAQLKAAPEVEFLAAKGTAWARICGKARFDQDLSIKERILEKSELVRSKYGKASNPVFAVFKIEHGIATLSDFSGNPPKTYSF